jgi:hypothetical protein
MGWPPQDGVDRGELAGQPEDPESADAAADGGGGDLAAVGDTQCLGVNWRANGSAAGVMGHPRRQRQRPRNPGPIPNPTMLSPQTS